MIHHQKLPEPLGLSKSVDLERECGKISEHNSYSLTSESGSSTSLPAVKSQVPNSLVLTTRKRFLIINSAKAFPLNITGWEIFRSPGSLYHNHHKHFCDPRCLILARLSAELGPGVKRPTAPCPCPEKGFLQLLLTEDDQEVGQEKHLFLFSSFKATLLPNILSLATKGRSFN